LKEVKVKVDEIRVAKEKKIKPKAETEDKVILN
jgi:hypothetical protein